MTDISAELAKPEEDMNLTIISHWLRAAYPVGGSMIGDVARRLLQLARGRDFYLARYREFDKLARTLPEPYKTQAFNILANGKIAPWNETKQEVNTLNRLSAENALLRQWLRGELTISDADIDEALSKAAQP